MYWRLKQIEVVQVNNETKKLEKKFEFDHKYPATKIMWIPDNENCHPDIMVTSGDVLKVWNIVDNEKAELKCSLAGVVYSNPAKKGANCTTNQLRLERSELEHNHYLQHRHNLLNLGHQQRITYKDTHRSRQRGV